MSDTPRTDAHVAKIAESLGWMRAERNGVEVWYDPEGGHVVSLQLLEQMGESVPRAMAEKRELERELELERARVVEREERLAQFEVHHDHVCAQKDAELAQLRAFRDYVQAFGDYWKGFVRRAAIDAAMKEGKP